MINLAWKVKSWGGKTLWGSIGIRKGVDQTLLNVCKGGIGKQNIKVQTLRTFLPQTPGRLWVRGQRRPIATPHQEIITTGDWIKRAWFKDGGGEM